MVKVVGARVLAAFPVLWKRGPVQLTSGLRSAAWMLIHIPKEGEYRWRGFTEGFRMPFQGEWCPYRAPNLPTVKGMEEVVRQKN